MMVLLRYSLTQRNWDLNKTAFQKNGPYNFYADYTLSVTEAEKLYGLFKWKASVYL